MYLPGNTEDRDLYKRVLNTIYLDLSAGSEEIYFTLQIYQTSNHFCSPHFSTFQWHNAKIPYKWIFKLFSFCGKFSPWLILYLALRILAGPSSEPIGTYTQIVPFLHGCTLLSDDAFCGVDGKGMPSEWPKAFILSGWCIPAWWSNFSPVTTWISF